MTLIDPRTTIANDSQWILLIEDNNDHAELVRRTIAECKPDLIIQHVGDGQAACDYLQAIVSQTAPVPPPLAILLDLRLPRIDGFELLRFRRNRPILKVIPAIVLTSSTRESDIMEAELLQADGYHIKPLAPQACRQILNRALNLQ